MLHLKLKATITTTKLKILQLLFKIEQMWNQIHLPLKEIHCKKSSCSENFTERVQNPSVKLQQQISDVSSIEEFRAANERWRQQHQKQIEAASHLSRKQELQRNQVLH